MKSSIKITRGGRSISFRGGAARRAFEAITGTKIAPPAVPQSVKIEPAELKDFAHVEKPDVSPTLDR